MAMSHLALTLLLTFAASPEPVLLTPDKVAAYDYNFRCGVLNEGQNSRVAPTDPVVVYLRFAPKRKGIYALGAEDLKAIKAVSLVVRDGDAVQLSVPLRTEVDPGNYVHLYARFSAQRDLLPKMQLTFEEHGDAGKRTFLANLKDFIEEK
jgi:hypothetical protein